MLALLCGARIGGGKVADEADPAGGVYVTSNARISGL
jgi:hypothetical protein